MWLFFCLHSVLFFFFCTLATVLDNRARRSDFCLYQKEQPPLRPPPPPSLKRRNRVGGGETMGVLPPPRPLLPIQISQNASFSSSFFPSFLLLCRLPSFLPFVFQFNGARLRKKGRARKLPIVSFSQPIIFRGSTFLAN